MPRSLVVGTAGHIDHGKSALVRALTGIDPDRLQEEKARGITIDLGFAHLVHGDLTVAFVDVPGHERFVRNMLAGAGGIDAVILVIAADESVKPQTREHFDICRLLGIGRGLVALTKSDLVDAETLDIARADVADLVRGSFLEGAPIVPVSAMTGDGLTALVDAIASLTAEQPRQARGRLVRLPVDRVFTVKGFGTVVTGTLVSGRIMSGDALTVEPGERPARVRGLHVHGAPTEAAGAPTRVAVNLSGVGLHELTRGDTLATPGSLVAARRVDAHLQILAGSPPLKHGTRLRLHQGTRDALGRLSIAAWRQTGSGDWRRAQPGDTDVSIPPGGEALVRVRLDRPLAVTRHDRVVLRAPAPVGTVGGGVVLDPAPPSAGVRRRETFERFQRLLESGPALDVWLEETGRRGADLAAIVARSGSHSEAMAPALDAAVASGRAVASGGRFYWPPAVAALERELHEFVAAWHRDRPADPGPRRELVREQIARDASPDLFDALVARLQHAGRLVVSDRLALSTHRASAPAEELRAASVIEAALEDARLTPPDLATLAAAAKVSPAVAERALRQLVKEGRLVRLDVLWYHTTALAALRREIQQLGAADARGQATVDVATFKTKFGLTRKFAIPLLEWLDRERVTRRVGDRRLVL